MKRKNLAAMATGLFVSLLWIFPLQAERAKELEILKSLEGNWTVSDRVWNRGKEGKRTSSSSSISWVLKGSFLKEEYQPEGHQGIAVLRFLGYDVVKKKYFSVYMAESDMGLLQSEGPYDPATKTIKASGIGYSDEAFITTHREEWTIIDDDRFLYRSYIGIGNKGGKIKEEKFRESLYKRAR
jgi:hypothetical protein